MIALVWILLVGAIRYAQSSSFAEDWQIYKNWHQENAKNFDLDYANPMVSSENRYLIYTSDQSVPFEARWMGCAAALLYSVLTQRVFFVDQQALSPKLFPGLSQFTLPIGHSELVLRRQMPSLVFGPKRQEKFEWLTNTMDNTEEIRLFGCSSLENERRVQFLVLQSTDYFAPLLSLNDEYREKLLEWFPDRQVLRELSELMLGRKLQKTDAEKYSIVFDEDTFGPGLDHNVLYYMKNVTEAEVFLLTRHSQHFRQFAQYRKFKMPKLPKQYKTGQSTDSNRLEDILYAAQNATVFTTAESALGELIGALSGRPPLVISNTPCNRPSCCSCRPMRASDACYGRASLKAFVTQCIGSFSGNHAYADIFTRPDYIDACKSRVIGMQIIKEEPKIVELVAVSSEKNATLEKGADIDESAGNEEEADGKLNPINLEV